MQSELWTEHSGGVSSEYLVPFSVRPAVETELLRLVRAHVSVPTVSVIRYNRALFLQQKQQIHWPLRRAEASALCIVPLIL